MFGNSKISRLASLFFTGTRVVLRTFLIFLVLLVIYTISKGPLIQFFLVNNFCSRDAYSFYKIKWYVNKKHRKTYKGLVYEVLKQQSHLLHSSQNSDYLVITESDLSNAEYFIMSFDGDSWDFHTKFCASNITKTNHWFMRFSSKDKE